MMKPFLNSTAPIVMVGTKISEDLSDQRHLCSIDQKERR